MHLKEIIRNEQNGGKRLSESVDIINPKYSSPFRDKFLRDEREAREAKIKEDIERKLI